MTDKVLIDLLWARNESAIGEIARVYGPGLYRLALRVTGDEADAGECVNDTYLAAWNAIPPARPDSLPAYLYRICRNFAFGVLDKRNAEKRSAVLTELSVELQQCIPDKMEQYRMEALEIRDVLNHFLRGLKPEERMIFLRRYWYGDSIREIAVGICSSESKVKTQLHRTREKLKCYLEQEGINV